MPVGDLDGSSPLRNSSSFDQSWSQDSTARWGPLDARVEAIAREIRGLENLLTKLDSEKGQINSESLPKASPEARGLKRYKSLSKELKSSISQYQKLQKQSGSTPNLDIKKKINKKIDFLKLLSFQKKLEIKKQEIKDLEILLPLGDKRLDPLKKKNKSRLNEVKKDISSFSDKSSFSVLEDINLDLEQFKEQVKKEIGIESIDLRIKRPTSKEREELKTEGKANKRLEKARQEVVNAKKSLKKTSRVKKEKRNKKEIKNKLETFNNLNDIYKLKIKNELSLVRSKKKFIFLDQRLNTVKAENSNPKQKEIKNQISAYNRKIKEKIEILQNSDYGNNENHKTSEREVQKREHIINEIVELQNALEFLLEKTFGEQGVNPRVNSLFKKIFKMFKKNDPPSSASSKKPSSEIAEGKHDMRIKAIERLGEMAQLEKNLESVQNKIGDYKVLVDSKKIDARTRKCLSDVLGKEIKELKETKKELQKLIKNDHEKGDFFEKISNSEPDITELEKKFKRAENFKNVFDKILSGKKTEGRSESESNQDEDFNELYKSIKSILASDEKVSTIKTYSKSFKEPTKDSALHITRKSTEGMFKELIGKQWEKAKKAVFPERPFRENAKKEETSQALLTQIQTGLIDEEGNIRTIEIPQDVIDAENIVMAIQSIENSQNVETLTPEAKKIKEYLEDLIKVNNLFKEIKTKKKKKSLSNTEEGYVEFVLGDIKSVIDEHNQSLSNGTVDQENINELKDKIDRATAVLFLFKEGEKDVQSLKENRYKQEIEALLQSEDILKTAGSFVTDFKKSHEGKNSKKISDIVEKSFLEKQKDRAIKASKELEKGFNEKSFKEMLQVDYVNKALKALEEKGSVENLPDEVKPFFEYFEILYHAREVPDKLNEAAKKAAEAQNPGQKKKKNQPVTLSKSAQQAQQELQKLITKQKKSLSDNGVPNPEELQAFLSELNVKIEAVESQIRELEFLGSGLDGVQESLNVISSGKYPKKIKEKAASLLSEMSRLVDFNKGISLKKGVDTEKVSQLMKKVHKLKEIAGSVDLEPASIENLKKFLAVSVEEKIEYIQGQKGFADSNKKDSIEDYYKYKGLVEGISDKDLWDSQDLDNIGKFCSNLKKILSVTEDNTEDLDKFIDAIKQRKEKLFLDLHVYKALIAEEALGYIDSDKDGKKLSSYIEVLKLLSDETVAKEFVDFASFCPVGTEIDDENRFFPTFVKDEYGINFSEMLKNNPEKFCKLLKDLKNGSLNKKLKELVRDKLKTLKEKNKNRTPGKDIKEFTFDSKDKDKDKEKNEKIAREWLNVNLTFIKRLRNQQNVFLKKDNSKRFSSYLRDEKDIKTSQLVSFVDFLELTEEAIKKLESLQEKAVNYLSENSPKSPEELFEHIAEDFKETHKVLVQYARQGDLMAQLFPQDPKSKISQKLERYWKKHSTKEEKTIPWGTSLQGLCLQTATRNFMPLEEFLKRNSELESAKTALESSKGLNLVYNGSRELGVSSLSWLPGVLASPQSPQP